MPIFLGMANKNCLNFVGKISKSIPRLFVLFGLVRAVRAPSRTRTNANFFFAGLHFRQNLANLLCMHKKHTEYRFKLWYKVLKIIFFI